MVIFLLICCTSLGLSFAGVSYDRKHLQREYPGFGKNYILFPSESGEEIYGYLAPFTESRIRKESNSSELEGDVFYTYYSRKISDGRTFRKFKDVRSYFDRKKKTKLIVHGWMSSSESDYSTDLKNAYLHKYDVNVILVDWNAISSNIFYHVAMLATVNVAKHYAKLLNYLVDDLKIDPKDMHLIGHSLGSHISGFAGRNVKKGKVGRITGLDPALPGFTPLPFSEKTLLEEGRLNTNDSHFVDIIHTCAGFLGLKDPIGHVDFYPNGGGPPQPGCDILKFIEACSHGRSWKLYMDSITREKPFMATECSSWDYLTKAKCKGNEIPMGEPTPPSSRGIYYIKTTGSYPYISNISDFVNINNNV